MNKGKIAKMVGKIVKLRPMAKRFAGTGEELPEVDYPWQIQKILMGGIVLYNPGTTHSVRLGYDDIHDYRSDLNGGTDGFLMLKSQIFLKLAQAWVEPLI